MAITSRFPFLAPRPQGIFRVLTLCTGNICRSPQAEQLLRKRIPEAFGRTIIEALDVSSAGTRANDGAAMERWAIAEAQRLGIDDTADHVARRLRRSHALEADLILTMTCDHRDAVTKVTRRVKPKSFTLVEFTCIVEALADRTTLASVAPLGPEGFAAFMRGVVVAAGQARATVPLPKPAMLLDIPDPYGYGPEVYRSSADAIDRHVTRIAAALSVLAAGGRAARAEADLPAL
ncbi:hypothetical protein [Agrococcus beijingensis]|uniref:arsenate reductase/protein-tyrosine-phosphatase family protein n=1 Tax=Agrococcus beijingensis TaxID=3068634 RepID=UPI0027412DA5|nr:hypothetical protein [Agrococcus sp. REN33]